MNKVDQTIDRAADWLQRQADLSAGQPGVKAKLAQVYADDADFLRKLKPSLIAARARGRQPHDEPASRPAAPAGPQVRDEPASEPKASRGPATATGHSGRIRREMSSRVWSILGSIRYMSISTKAK